MSKIYMTWFCLKTGKWREFLYKSWVATLKDNIKRRILFFNLIAGAVHKKEGANSQIEALLRPLKVMFALALEEEESEDLNVKKIPLHLIETISHLVHKVPFKNDVKEDKVIFIFSNIFLDLLFLMYIIILFV